MTVRYISEHRPPHRWHYTTFGTNMHEALVLELSTRDQRP
jgi:hypothetical protein